LTAVSTGSGAISSQEISSLPSSHRMSAYRSKYLQDKEQQQAELSSSAVKSLSKDTTSVAPPDQKDGNNSAVSYLTGAITATNSLKDDMQRFFTKLMQKSFLAAYCNINPSV